MGCFDPKDPVTEDQKIRSRQLEKNLKVWNKNFQDATKVLLLGMANHHLVYAL